MSDHDWPGDHHDGHDGHDDPADYSSPAEDLPQPQEQPHLWEIADSTDDTPGWVEHEDHDDPGTHDVPPYDDGLGDHVPTDEHVSAPEVVEAHDDPDVFPPTVDVGALPEPVDGWPWIDTSSLGLTGIETRALQAPAPQDLADYNAEELPPAADPWAALAGSEDPATAALAEFYRPGGPGADA